MKKFAFLLAAVMCLPLAACGNSEAVSSDAAVSQPAQESGRTEATEFVFELAEEEERYVENLVFNEPVTISGDFGQIIFVNCEFNADITNTAELYTRVLLLEGSVVNGKCILKNGTKEATMETPFPKFITSVPVEVVCEDCIGTAVALGNFELVFNGETYTMEDSELFYDCSKPENGFVPYEGQDASCYAVGQWWENGDKTILIECEYDPDM